MKYSYLLIFLLLFLCRVNVNAVNETVVGKEKLYYEINSITFSNNRINISGWGFINETQHYLNASDHSIEIEFISINNIFRVQTVLNSRDLTSDMLEAGNPTCAANIYNQDASICNYSYQYVGFSLSIPLSSFIEKSSYVTYLVFHANNSNLHYKTPLYFPIVSDIVNKLNDYEYRISSKLNDTSLKIIETPVYVRKTPSKSSTIWTYGNNCSTTYTNKLYYKINSVYSKIYSKVIESYLSYYELRVVPDICVDSRRRVIEGGLIYPAWISSLWVSYSGSPLTISSTLINSAPVLYSNDIFLLVDQTFNPMDYVVALDKEEGDITSKVTIEHNTYENKPGSYQITYYVEDKYAYTAKKSVFVYVAEPFNNYPSITAYDKTIFQYSKFNPLHEVSAYDIEDQDITSRIIVESLIDTSTIGDQSMCYLVADSKQASTRKCITISVINNDEMYKGFRYISKNYLFYKEFIPSPWINIETELLLELNSLTIIQTNTILR